MTGHDGRATNRPFESLAPEDFDDDHDVPADLVELFEIVEWQRAVDEQTESTVKDMEGLE